MMNVKRCANWNRVVKRTRERCLRSIYKSTLGFVHGYNIIIITMNNIYISPAQQCFLELAMNLT